MDGNEEAATRADAASSLLPRKLRLTTVCGALAASLALLCIELGQNGTLAAFLLGNQLDPSRRVLGVGAVLGLAVFVAGVVLLRLRRAAGAEGLARVEALQRRVHLLAPLGIAFALPPLFVRELWRGTELAFLIYAGAISLLFERLMRVSLTAVAEAPPRRISVPRVAWLGRWLPRIVLGLGMAWYFVVISRGVVLNHLRIGTTSSDLAEFDNLFFNALHGHPFRSPAIEGNLADWSALKVHAEAILYLLLPVYALAPGPQTLLVLQTAVIALCAVPVYVLCARRNGAWAGALLGLAYLLLPAVVRPNFYDFHFPPFGMFFVLCTLALYDRYAALAQGDRARRRWLVATCCVFALSLLSREDIATGLGIALTCAALGGLAPRLGLSLAAIAFTYVALIKFCVMPLFGQMWFDIIYQRLKAPGEEGLGAVLHTIVTNPVFVLRVLMSEPRLVYVLHMTVPLLALWLRRPYLWAAALPGLFFTLMVTDRPPMIETGFQYTFLWVPYVVMASALGLHAIAGADPRGWPRKAAALTALLCVAVACSVNLGAVLGGESVVGGFGEKRLGPLNELERARLGRLQRLIADIPPDASVAATELEGPHVSTRLVMYSLKYTFGDHPDYVLVGTISIRYELEHLIAALQLREYGVVKSVGEFTLLKRGADPKTVQPLLQRLASMRYSNLLL
jgi:uncharacterized membrane protein